MGIEMIDCMPGGSREVSCIAGNGMHFGGKCGPLPFSIACVGEGMYLEGKCGLVPFSRACLLCWRMNELLGKM